VCGQLLVRVRPQSFIFSALRSWVLVISGSMLHASSYTSLAPASMRWTSPLSSGSISRSNSVWQTILRALAVSAIWSKVCCSPSMDVSSSLSFQYKAPACSGRGLLIDEISYYASRPKREMHITWRIDINKLGQAALEYPKAGENGKFNLMPIR